jgi:hypothetical protein
MRSCRGCDRYGFYRNIETVTQNEFNKFNPNFISSFKYVSAIGENFKKFSVIADKKMCKTPNICLLKSCVGHHLMIGCNRCVECVTELRNTSNYFKTWIY